ncbi:MAG: hypothetical protein R6U44_00600 [Archaeoglobaceae archaeon]
MAQNVGVSSKKLLVDWHHNPKEKHLNLPWMGKNNHIEHYKCYANCLTAYLSYVDALTGLDISQSSGDYDKLLKELSNEVNTDYSTFVKSTESYFKSKNIPLSIKILSFRNTEGRVDEATLRRFLYDKMLPVIAIIDHEAFNQGRESPNSNHSVVILGVTTEGYLLYNPITLRGVEPEHKVKFNSAWKLKLYEGIFLVKKGMRIQSNKASTGMRTLYDFLG